MKMIAAVIWLFVPLGAFAYHYGPGQARMQLDETAPNGELIEVNRQDIVVEDAEGE